VVSWTILKGGSKKASRSKWQGRKSNSIWPCISIVTNLPSLTLGSIRTNFLTWPAKGGGNNTTVNLENEHHGNITTILSALHEHCGQIKCRHYVNFNVLTGHNIKIDCYYGSNVLLQLSSHMLELWNLLLTSKKNSFLGSTGCSKCQARIRSPHLKRYYTHQLIFPYIVKTITIWRKISLFHDYYMRPSRTYMDNIKMQETIHCLNHNMYLNTFNYVHSWKVKN
jgi:hypothetical protein